MKNIVVIPAWYTTDESSNTGSFFREQSVLMSDKYHVRILHFEKNWVSWRRAIFENRITKPNKLRPLNVAPPAGDILAYNFVKRFSQEKNAQIMFDEITIGFEQYIAKYGKPDLIHAHCTFTAGIIAHHISKSFQIPFIITEHYGPFILSEFDSFYHARIKNALESANEVLAVSEHQKQHILLNRIDCNPIVVGNLVDDEMFTPKKERQIDKTLKLVFVTFYPSYIKDPTLFFDAMELLQKENIPFNVTLIGGKSGSEFGDAYYQQEIEKRNLNNYCTHILEASREEMALQLQKADIYISTSISESFGITACEALLCGTPYVSTKNGGIMEFHSDDFGTIVAIKDPAAFVEGIKHVHMNLENYSTSAMRASIVEHYGKKAFFTKIDTIYESVLH